MGHAPVIANSKPGPLGENQDPCGEKQEQNMLHEVEGHVRRRHCQQQLKRTEAPLAAPRTLGIWGMRRLGVVTLGVAPVQHPLLLEPAAARTSCSMVQNSKYYFATGQRGADGKRAVASATTSILRKAPKKKNAPHPNIVNRSVRTLAAHASTVTPKRRHVA